VILLHEEARTDQPYRLSEAKKHWMKRIVGAEGCWRVGPEAVNRRLKPTRLVFSRLDWLSVKIYLTVDEYRT